MGNQEKNKKILKREIRLQRFFLH